MFVKSTETFLRTFLEAFEKFFISKHEDLSEYSNSILSFISSKSQLFLFFLTYDPIGVLCGHDFCFYWYKDLGSVDLSDTSSMFVKPAENFLEAFDKKFQFKKWGRNEFQNAIGIFWQNLIFWAESFFSNDSRNFSVDFTNMFKVSERFA